MSYRGRGRSWHRGGGHGGGGGGGAAGDHQLAQDYPQDYQQQQQGGYQHGGYAPAPEGALLGDPAAAAAAATAAAAMMGDPAAALTMVVAAQQQLAMGMMAAAAAGGMVGMPGAGMWPGDQAGMMAAQQQPNHMGLHGAAPAGYMQPPHHTQQQQPHTGDRGGFRRHNSGGDGGWQQQGWGSGGGGHAREPAAAAAGPRSAKKPNVALGVHDYCQHFVDTKQRPQNFVVHADLEQRFAGYPNQKRLYDAKTQQIAKYSTPAYAMRTDLKKQLLSPKLFGTKFDVILIDPPWEEYVRRAPGFVPQGTEAWTWREIQALAVDAIADTPSFVFLWCGCEEGLQAGRACLKAWGFTRVEDICWIKTNKDKAKTGRPYLSADFQEANSMLTHTTEHCLVGMRGKLKRSVHHAFVHATCDTDIIVSEEPPLGSTQKPEELYGIIERFCNGRRRLELFGNDHNVREGWVTVGKDISRTNFKPQAYLEQFKNENGVPYTEHRGGCPPPGAPCLVPTTADIERLREKSPPRHQGGARR